MNQRNILIIIVVVIVLLVAFHSCKKIEIKQKSTDEASKLTIEMKKETPNQ